MTFWRKTPERFLADENEIRAAVVAGWQAEWNANRAAALAAMPSAAPFQIWQTDAGWWVVGRWEAGVSPPFRGHQYLCSYYGAELKPLKKPDLTVKAFGHHRPFEPQFKTIDEAEGWLRDLVNPPPVKRYDYDANGQLLALRVDEQRAAKARGDKRRAADDPDGPGAFR